MEKYRIKRKNAIPIASAIREYLRDAHLTTGLNTRLIFKAWDEVSGASSFTLKRFFRSGKLYITLNSSGYGVIVVFLRSRITRGSHIFIALISSNLSKAQVIWSSGS